MGLYGRAHVFLHAHPRVLFLGPFGGPATAPAAGAHMLAMDPLWEWLSCVPRASFRS